METAQQHERKLIFRSAELFREMCKHCGAVCETRNGEVKHYHPITGHLKSQSPKCITRNTGNVITETDNVKST